MKSAKHPLKTWLATGLAALVPLFAAHAGTEVVGGVTWIYTVEGGKATVTGATPAEGTLKIPSRLGGHAVTRIGYRAFRKQNVTVVKIPDSVKDIGEAAFAGCSRLQAVTIGNGVTNIGTVAFDYCRTLSSVTFGKGLKSIGEDAFSSCFKLAAVKLPDSVEHIGDYAFCDCTGLKKLTIGKHVKAIGAGAFSGCDRLTSVKIPDNVTDLGCDAFYHCDALTNATIGKGVKNIPAGAFNHCANLVSVKIPGTVTNIGGMAFERCYALPSVTIPGSVKSIGDVAFGSCNRLKSVTIPHSVKSLGGHAFTECRGLRSVKIGNGVKNIYNGTFLSCTNLKTASLGSGLKTIECEAFRGCSALASVAIPDSVTYIGIYAFYGCSGLVSARIGDGVKEIDQKAFYGCSAMKSLQIGNSVTNIMQEAFAYCSSLESLFIPGSVEHIYPWAFKNCTGLKTLTIASGVKSVSIASDAFEGAERSLETLYLAESLKDGWLWRNWELLRDNAFPVQYLAEQRVDFNAMGGDCAVASNSYLHSRAYGWLPKATRAGYVFAGWFTQSAGGTQVTAKSTVTETASRTLYAHWSLVYTVKFDANGGKGAMADQRLPRDAAANLSANKFTRNGYVFMGWSRSKTGPVAYADKASVKNLAAAGGSTTLHARWAKARYKVAFNATGGKGAMAAQALTYGQTAKLRKNAFTRDGFVFMGWATSRTGAVVHADGEGVRNLRSDGGTVTLYAKWARKNYSVEFAANGGTGRMAPQAMVYGKTAKLRGNAFVRKGYVFAGWSKTKNGKVAYKDRQAVMNLRTDGKTSKLYAQWTKESCKVKFDNGTVSLTRTVKYNAQVGTLPPGPEKYGYVFAGWYTARSGGIRVSSTTRITADCTLYARMTPISYTIRYDYAGGTPGAKKPASGTYGTAFCVSAPAKAGAVFAGWSVPSGLDTGPAKWGTASNPSTSIPDSAARCANGRTGNVYFLNLRSTSGSVTLKANWSNDSGEWNDFSTGGDAAWFLQTATTHDGVDAYQSGIVGDGQSSWMQHSVTGPGTISFWWKVSSEYCYDFLDFLVDGALQLGISGTNGDWAEMELSVEGSGVHVFTWSYAKDGSVSEGSDCGWVDQVIWTPADARASMKSAKNPGKTGGCAAPGTLPAERVFSTDDCGVFGIGTREIEISPEPPPVEELGGREWAVEPAVPLAVTFRVPEGGRAWQFWSAERGILADEGTAGKTVTLQLPDLGIWYWLRFLGDGGETLASTWLFPAE